MSFFLVPPPVGRLHPSGFQCSGRQSRPSAKISPAAKCLYGALAPPAGRAADGELSGWGCFFLDSYFIYVRGKHPRGAAPHLRGGGGLPVRKILAIRAFRGYNGDENKARRAAAHGGEKERGRMKKRKLLSLLLPWP